MKKFTLALLLTVISSQAMAGDQLGELVSFTTLAPTYALECVVGNPEIPEQACRVATISVSISFFLLKEAQAVKSDALMYAAGEEASPALESVVEKIQSEAELEGKEVSFDDVIDLINTL